MKKINVLVLGSTGMLGNTVTKYLLKNSQLNIIPTHRTDTYKLTHNSIKYDILQDNLSTLPQNIDYVINCVGIIKPFVLNNIEATIKINSLFPWELSRWADSNNCKIIHITTDCVYSGKKGKYIETDLHDALDIYGKSKSLGEISSEAMVLRTSIIGEELHNYASLISWAKSQKGKIVDGYKTHYWNGITTLEYAKCCEKIIKNDLYQKGLYHIFASTDVTKYELLNIFNTKYNLNLNIKKSYPEKIDRTLRTSMNLCSILKIPSVNQMLEVL